MPDIFRSARAGIKTRWRDVGGGILAEEVVSLPEHGSRVANGRFYLAGTGRMALTVAGNIRAVIQNPATSGRNVRLVRIAGLATGTAWADLLLNPTAGVPATAARPVLNAIAGGGVAPVATIRADTDATVALSGGATGLTVGVPANQRFALDLPPLVLAPGVTLGINAAFAGAADLALSVYWYEDPV